MQITINVDDTMFSEVAEKELKALSSEDMKKVLLAGIAEYLRSHDYAAIDKLLFESCGYYSGKRPTKLTESLIQASANYDGLQDVVDKCIDVLKDKYPQLLQDVVARIIVNSLVDSYGLHQAMSDTVTKMLDAERAKAQYGS